VNIFGEEYAVHAGIHTIGGFSAHAGRHELLEWQRRTGSPERTFLVHGEKDSMTAFGQLLTGTRVEMPELHQSFEL
jgi:metallo-beta-lactamase family protein